MTLNEYQDKAMTTCMPSSKNFSYMFLNLVGEVGEFASKVAKHIRKEELAIGGNSGGNMNHLTLPYGSCGFDVIQANEELKKEVGDILWQLSGLCSVMYWNLEDIAQMNLDKLASRKERNVIDGNGDNR